MIQGLFYLFGLLWIGEAVVRGLGLPIPGNVVGMVLLTFCLSRGIIRLEQVQAASGVLIRNLAFLFVPPGVGLMVYTDLIRTEWPAIAAGFLLSSFAVLAVTGWVQQGLEKEDSP